MATNNANNQQQVVQQPQVVYVQQPQQSGGLIEILGIGVGLLAGYGVGNVVSRMLPEAVTTVDKVVRAATVYGSAIVTQKLVSDAIIGDAQEIIDVTGKAVTAAQSGQSVQAAIGGVIQK